MSTPQSSPVYVHAWSPDYTGLDSGFDGHVVHRRRQLRQIAAALSTGDLGRWFYPFFWTSTRSW